MKLIKPNRNKYSCTQQWKGSIDELFPLLCPVREMEYVPGWNPTLVVSDSGVVEQDCLFIVPDSPADSIWVVNDYRPENYSF